MNPLNTWIAFSTIERVETNDQNSKIADEFKKLQLDIRNGDPKNGEH